MYWGSRVFNAMAASPLLAGDDQVTGGNNSCMVGSLRSVIDTFSSTFSRVGGCLAGAGSGSLSLASCSSFRSTAFFGAGTALAGTDFFGSGEFLFAIIAGDRALRVGASRGSWVA